MKQLRKVLFDTFVEPRIMRSRVYYLQISSTNSGNTNVLFNNLQLSSIYFGSIDNNRYIYLLSQSVFFLVIPACDITLNGSTLSQMNLQSMNLFTISAQILNISSTEIVSISSTSSYGFIFLFADKLTIE